MKVRIVYDVPGNTPIDQFHRDVQTMPMAQLAAKYGLQVERGSLWNCQDYVLYPREGSTVTELPRRPPNNQPAPAA